MAARLHKPGTVLPSGQLDLPLMIERGVLSGQPIADHSSLYLTNYPVFLEGGLVIRIVIAWRPAFRKHPYSLEIRRFFRDAAGRIHREINKNGGT